MHYLWTGVQFGGLSIIRAQLSARPAYDTSDSLAVSCTPALTRTIMSDGGASFRISNVGLVDIIKLPSAQQKFGGWGRGVAAWYKGVQLLRLIRTQPAYNSSLFESWKARALKSSRWHSCTKF